MKKYILILLCTLIVSSCYNRDEFQYWVRVENTSDTDFERVISDYEGIHTTDFGGVSRYSTSNYLKGASPMLLTCQALKLTIDGRTVVRERDGNCQTLQIAPPEFGRYTLKINYTKDGKIEANMIKD